jgi:uncharacterized membrane protein (GlpM family)
MLLLKLTIVPIIIALITLAGRKWGSHVAGMLGGMPVVAGPIVVLLAVDQGVNFGIHAGTSAIAGVASLLTFGVAYCWISLRYTWPLALIGAVLSWLITANFLVLLPSSLTISLIVAVMALLLTPRLLPQWEIALSSSKKSNDLIWRMLAGGLLVFFVTQFATVLGGVWSGILAIFPVIGSVIAIFTHHQQSAEQVTVLYRGMVRGLISLVLFFSILTLGWSHWTLWQAVILAVVVAIGSQALIQLWTLYVTQPKLAQD